LPPLPLRCCHHRQAAITTAACYLLEGLVDRLTSFVGGKGVP